MMAIPLESTHELCVRPRGRCAPLLHARRAVILAAWLASAWLPAGAGIGVGKEIALVHPGFETGLVGWSPWSSNGQPVFYPSSGPQGGLTTVRASLSSAVAGELSQTFDVGPAVASSSEEPARARVGDKLEFGAWVWLGADCTAGDVLLRVTTTDGASTTAIAESQRLSAASAPKLTWLYLHTVPIAGFDARIPPGTLRCSTVLRDEMQGTVYFDTTQCGRFEYSEYALIDNSFENDADFASAWSKIGNAALSTAGVDPDGYYGARYLRLAGAQPASVRQTFAIRDGHGSPSPLSKAEACTWFVLEDDTAGWIGPAVELNVYAWKQGTPLKPSDRISSATYVAGAQNRGTWLFLQTQPTVSPTIGLDRTHLVVEIKKLCSGTVRADFVQAGEQFGVNGNPRKHVACSYVGVYRSPLAGYGSTSPTHPALIWRNWLWTDPPACNQNQSGLAHNPDCATSPQCFRPNGRRNVAASEENSSDDLPLVGAYDSRDRDVMRYHVRLARAMGIDSFVFDHYGHALMRQEASFGIEPLIEETYETLLDVCDEPGVDLKVAVMYEPKSHLYGWVIGEPTLADKKLGIIDDLVHLVSTYFARRCVLLHDGRMVIYVFRNTVCSPDGTQCLGDTDWAEIRAAVELATARPICLIADKPPGATNPFDGASRWQLVALPILQYQTYNDFLAHQPSLPAPTVPQLYAHANAVNVVATQWAALDDAHRFTVPLVWPGFDDAGVAGWSSINFTGKNGQPLCLRIAAPLAGAFYATTWSAAFDTGSDWVQIGTWNDWNERTEIEPQWNAAYAQAALANQPAPPQVTQAALGRALETQAWIAAFKRKSFTRGFSPVDIDHAARAYLRDAAFSGTVPQYD